ncbi:3,4-dihydroxy-2-butanone-4-phosphate synthase [Candidatus Micrarchaeota archaeon]|nr:3,4-dihydroxy-2-butanone-4-phosphate synthase [Candidatus Micrarchaeota archaeon]MBU1681897.1 3,4-dihydroxy-2-butanone-4-phosphate synthase [Candidatus Micrarchaeota archaeon]
MSLEEVVDHIKNGEMIVVFDGDDREGEADLIFGAKFTTPDRVEILRREAGGLICVAISKEKADKLKLPFYTELIEKNKNIKELSCDKTAYGDRPAFSVSVNHRNVFTGITDNDRALTITKLEQVLEKDGFFTKEFYSPGHVFLLISSGIEKRKGHTELAMEIGARSEQNAMVLCEMLGSGSALSKERAKRYAERNGLLFIEGKEILEGIKK